jgi:thioredoxin 1
MTSVYTDANFEKEVLQADKLTIVDFWAPWCGPCINVGRIVDELAVEYEGRINVGKLNSDENPDVSVEYGVIGLPCVLFVKGGKVVDKQMGMAAKNVFEKKVQQHI